MRNPQDVCWVDAYSQGYVDRCCGKDRSECPHEESDDRSQWLDGFDDADREYCSGARRF